jgi:hypothetical protein
MNSTGLTSLQLQTWMFEHLTPLTRAALDRQGELLGTDDHDGFLRATGEHEGLCKATHALFALVEQLLDSERKAECEA